MKSVSKIRGERVKHNPVTFLINVFFAATNVGDEGGFAPNIQDNKEGEETTAQVLKNLNEIIATKNKV